MFIYRDALGFNKWHSLHDHHCDVISIGKHIDRLPQVQVGFGGRKDSLPMLRDDKELSLRIFLDGTVAEVSAHVSLPSILSQTDSLVTPDRDTGWEGAWC